MKNIKGSSCTLFKLKSLSDYSTGIGIMEYIWNSKGINGQFFINRVWRGFR